MTHPAMRNIEQLSWAIATQGVTALEPQVADIVAVAQEWEVDPVLIAVLEDRTAPDVVRERAFGAIAASLAGMLEPTGSESGHRATLVPHHSAGHTRKAQLVG